MAMSPRLLRPRAPGGYTLRALRQGLVAYWPMNETATSGDVLVGDETGRGNHLGSVNSVLSVAGQSGNGREFTAANSEWLAPAGANNDLKFADGRDWTIAGWIYVPTWTTGMFFIANDSTSNREIVFDLRAASGNNLGCNLNPGGAGGSTAIAGSSMALNTWHFWAFTYTHATGVLSARVNNGVGVNTTSVTRGGGSLVQSTQPLNFGRRQFTGANAHFGGRLDEVAKWDRVLTTAELDTLWNNGNGINLSAPRAASQAFPAVTNADAQSWINNVYANGGTVSTATAAAVNTFATSIESAGLRSRLWRVNPMAGESLSAALVPLYRGPSSGGTQYGDATDTNDNFVSGDYVASTGLIGNGSTKRLRTGLPLNFSATRHLGCFVHTLATATFRAYLGGTGATAFSGLFRLTNGSPVTNYSLTGYNEASGAGGSGGTSVHAAGDFVLGAQGDGSGTAIAYTNGVISGTAGVGRTSGTVTTGISVFAEAQGGGTFSTHSNARLGGYTIGDNLSESQALAYYNIWDTLVRALGRK